MNKGFVEKIDPVGVVYRRLFDTKRLEVLKKAILEGASKERILELELWASKPQFADNFIWKIIHKHFGKDLKIPFITGVWTLKPIKGNLIVTKGHQQIAQQLGGTTTTPMTAIAIGTGTTAAAAGDTALQTEITTNGGARGAATVTNVTVTNTGDTEQWVKTFSFTGSFAVTEEGILDNNTSGGNLLSHQVFSAVNVVSGDSLQITHKVTC